MNQTQLHKEIEEISNHYLFSSYNSYGYNHISERHIDINLYGLKRRLALVEPEDEFDIKTMSRFSKGTSWEEIAKMISKCLFENEKEIASNLKEYSGISKKYVFDFSTVIGEGIVKGLGDKLFPMSRLIVVAGPSSQKGRVLEVVSAYPEFDYDETDVILDLLYSKS